MQPPPYDEPVETPAYLASLEFYGVALAKVELDTPWSNHAGHFRPVVVELNSNQLKLYSLRAPKAVTSTLHALFVHQNYTDREVRAEPRETLRDYMFDGDAYGDDYGSGSDGVFARLKKHYLGAKVRKRLSGPIPEVFLQNRLLLEPTADGAEYARFAREYRGPLIRCNTLLNLVVGEAPSMNLCNYKEDGSSEFALLNYRNALRLRVEFSQLLLHFWSFYGMVHWYRRLCIGRDLALLLDVRCVAPLKSIPRHYSARNNEFFAAQEDVRRKPRADGPERERAARGSVGSVDSDSSASATSLTSSGTSSASSVDDSASTSSSPAPYALTSKTAPQSVPYVSVYGHHIVCYEDVYLPLEKQYISNCISVLNSYEKWVGQKVTISNFRSMLPKNDAYNVNEGDGRKVFISLATFNSLARAYRKSAPSTGISQCKEYYVDAQGLVSIED